MSIEKWGHRERPSRKNHTEPNRSSPSQPRSKAPTLSQPCHLPMMPAPDRTAVGHKLTLSITTTCPQLQTGYHVRVLSQAHLIELLKNFYATGLKPAFSTAAIHKHPSK